MNGIIKNAILRGDAVLFLGAGASSESKDQSGQPIIQGPTLAKKIAEDVGLPYKNEPLAKVYAAAKIKLGNSLSTVLRQYYEACEPSDAYKIFAQFPWARIYTINIDDAYENAFQKSSIQKYKRCCPKSVLVERDQFYEKIEYVKLNGSIETPEDGFIFSPREYAAEPSHWYKQLAADYHTFQFIFIGTKLDEPCFNKVIEKYHSETNKNPRVGYLITPSCSEIDGLALQEFKIEHICGTADDFAKWLQSEFPNGLTPFDIVSKRNPVLMHYAKQSTKDIDPIVDEITYVNKDILKLESAHHGFERKFYMGFKPTWQDIYDNVHATTHYINGFINYVKTSLANNIKLAIGIGPAGSGKTTSLMHLAAYSDSLFGVPAYYATNTISDPIRAIRFLEKTITGNFLFFIDKVDGYADDLNSYLESRNSTRSLVVTTDSIRTWNKRNKFKLSKFCDGEYNFSTIDRRDAILVLDKIHQFGRWTRLANMTEEERISELMDKAKRQLLIGLLEATRGIGFEQIIENDYLNIGNKAERILLIMISLATRNKSPLTKSFLLRATTYLNFDVDFDNLISSLGGIVLVDNEKYYARHTVYAEHLITSVVDRDELHIAICAVLSSYSGFKTPIILHSGKVQGLLFKMLLNSRFLNEVFRKDENIVLNIYREFEKVFDADGHFWLQYGLALRSFKLHNEAYEKISTSCDVYKQPYAEHALAQQQIILSLIAESKVQAGNLFRKAADILIELDNRHHIDDHYPIVTLAEGYIKFLQKYDSIQAAQNKAKEYANELDRRRKSDSRPRLQQAWERIANYAMKGAWCQKTTIDNWL